MLKHICKYIQANDRNGDIMDAYTEYQNGELGRDELTEICQNILGEWREDLEIGGGLTKRVRGYYEYLGIDGELSE